MAVAVRQARGGQKSAWVFMAEQQGLHNSPLGTFPLAKGLRELKDLPPPQSIALQASAIEPGTVYAWMAEVMPDASHHPVPAHAVWTCHCTGVLSAGNAHQG